MKNYKFLAVWLLSLLAVATATARPKARQWMIDGRKCDVERVAGRRHVASGVTLDKYLVPAMPLQVSVLTIDLNTPGLSVETCLGADQIVGRETPTSMAQRKSRPGHRVVAAVNGDFYMTKPKELKGMPRSGQVSRDELVENPVGRACLVIDDNNRPYIDRVDWTGTIACGDSTFRLHTVNMMGLEKENTGGNQTFLFTGSYGPVTYDCSGGVKVQLSAANGSFNWMPTCSQQCVVDTVYNGDGTTPIPPGKAILWLQGSDTTHARTLSKGTTCTLNFKTTLRSCPDQLVAIKELVGGSDHIFMRNGAFLDDWAARHPRTCAGYNAKGDRLYLVVIDGRSEASCGVTLKEAYGVLKALGAYNAVNLDGGGSSCMVVDGQVVNSPSDGHVRAVGNGLLVVEN